MRTFLLRMLGAEPPRRVVLQIPPLVTRQELGEMTTETSNLARAVETLSAKLDKTVTVDEVSQELNGRVSTLEAGMARLVVGAKDQIRRTRRSGWMLLAMTIAVIGWGGVQVYDAHLNECLLSPTVTRPEYFVCQAVFPFTDHEEADYVRLGLQYVAGVENPQMVSYDYPISPRLVGGAAYAMLITTMTIAFVRYRTRLRAEEHIEIGSASIADLHAVSAAQDDPPSLGESQEDVSDDPDGDGSDGRGPGGTS